MNSYNFSVVEVPSLTALQKVSFVPGQYIILTTGEVYYDPTTGLSKEDRVCVSEGRKGAVDQVFDGESTNAQSGKAIERRLASMQTIIDAASDALKSVTNPYGPTGDQSVTNITWEEVENLIGSNATGIYRIINSKSGDDQVTEDGWAIYWIKDSYAYLLELRGCSDPSNEPPVAQIKIGSAITGRWFYSYPLILSSPDGGLNADVVGFNLKDVGTFRRLEDLWTIRDDGIYKYTMEADSAGHDYIPQYSNFLIVTNTHDTCITYMFSTAGTLTVTTIDKPTGETSTKVMSDVVFSGSYNDLKDTPILSKVATSGSYNDLKDTPILYGTEDLTAGVSELADGKIYIVYE